MVSGFSVQKVVIEGFKGFTVQKEIDFKSRHVFLLGQNGKGKSSVVEAVRWGLFGSTGRRNEIVANQRYAGRCRVTVTLIREGEEWTLRRTLIRGSSGGNDALLTDQAGNEHSIRDIMPQLDSVDAGEGMHIIFAPQSAPLRRQPENLDAFERTVFNYLGLTHPRVLLSHIDEFIDSHALAEESLGVELTHARSDIENQIALNETIRSNIVSSPPWGSGRQPSIVVSERKARSLIEEITGNPLGDTFEGFSLDALIDSAEESLSTKLSQDQGSLQEEANTLASHRSHLEELRDIRTEIKSQNNTIQETQCKFERLLGGHTLDQLEDRIAAAKEEATTESLKDRMTRDALVLLDRYQTDQILCPICESHQERQRLETALQDPSRQQSDEIIATVNALESQHLECRVLQVLLNEHIIPFQCEDAA